MNITIIGLGYVGISNAILYSLAHKVIAYDIDENKVKLINNRKSPIKDKDVEYFLQNKKLNLYATTDSKSLFSDAEIILIATPTNYDPQGNYFDTSSVDKSINEISKFSPRLVVIKSTIPVGYVEKKRKEYPNLKIIFSPEFLREGRALNDLLYPSRIVVGDHSEEAKNFARITENLCLKRNVEILHTNPSEAESIKLFSNTYLAMRVAFFNELDTYAELRNMNTSEIILGLGLDPRIGKDYNNPSFGYGGYCLPKDTKQLLANYEDVPQNIMSAIVEANKTRKDHIADVIISKKPKTVGIYRLVMKNNSDNFRESAIIGIMKRLKEKNIKMFIFEPLLFENDFMESEVIKNLDLFKNKSDIIISNRYSEELNDVKEKFYTRDIFNKD